MSQLFGIFLLVFSFTFIAQAEEGIKTDKPWTVQIGPVITGALPANNNANGTKFAMHAAYEMGINEYFSWDLFYNSNFNTASMGLTQVATFGAGATYFFKDRAHDTSAYVGLDLGYGGANRYMEAAHAAAATVGIRFFRTKELSFDMCYRRMMVATTAVDRVVLPNYPMFNQFLFGANF